MAAPAQHLYADLALLTGSYHFDFFVLIFNRLNDRKCFQALDAWASQALFLVSKMTVYCIRSALLPSLGRAQRYDAQMFYPQQPKSIWV
jgi:hypothetical protein